MYSLEKVNKNKKVIKIGATISGSLFLIMLALLVTFGLLTNDDNALIFETLSIIVSICSGFACLYILLELVYLKIIENKFLNSIIRAPRIKISGIVKSKNQYLTTSKYRKSFVISLEIETNHVVSVFSDNVVDIELDKKYEFETANNFVISFKEISE